MNCARRIHNNNWQQEEAEEGNPGIVSWNVEGRRSVYSNNNVNDNGNMREERGGLRGGGRTRRTRTRRTWKWMTTTNEKITLRKLRKITLWKLQKIYDFKKNC